MNYNIMRHCIYGDVLDGEPMLPEEREREFNCINKLRCEFIVLLSCMCLCTKVITYLF